MLLDLSLKVFVCWCFQAQGPGLLLHRIVVLRSGPRKPGRGPSEVRVRLGPAVATQGIKGELWRIAAADENAERAVALRAGGGRRRAAAAQQLARRAQLLLRVLRGDGGLDRLLVDPQLPQAAGDALGAPGI